MIKNSHTKRITQAQKFIQETWETASMDPLKPKYHFSVPVGWLNDPNGLVYYKGEYHLFYQYNPYNNRWGSMHWGHAKSRDLVKWEHLPVALAPSESYDNHDKGGCFSGSAIVVDDRLILMYTGVILKDDNTLVPTQNIAYSSDGITFEKYQGNPVITDFPEDGSADFRDPKVWEHEGEYYCVIGSGKDGIGKALLYKSDNMLNWIYMGVMAQSPGDAGFMWECTDFFTLDGTDILIFSPMKADIGITVYYTGWLDYKTGKFTILHRGQIDHGFDFYAPQSFVDEKGRRIIIAWLGSWDWCEWFNDYGPSWQKNWCGHMSIPRQVTVGQDGTLRFQPIEEVGNYCESIYKKSHIQIKSGESVTVSDSTASFRLSAVINSGSTANQIVFDLHISHDKRYFTRIVVDLENKSLTFDRTNSDDYSKGIKSYPFYAVHGDMELEIYCDSCCIEVFLGEGKTCFTGNVFPVSSHNQIAIGSYGGDVLLDAVKVERIVV